MSGYLIGVDGGGTKTEYLLAAPNGEILKKVAHAQTNLSVAGLGMAAFNLREGIRQLLENYDNQVPIDVLVLALAGLDNQQERLAAQKVLSQTLNTWKIKKLILLNDTIAALVNGSTAPQAMILISGTGSNCFGYNKKGQHHCVGGLGHLLSDEGSGYDAGRLALKATVMSLDGRTIQSALASKILKYFDVPDIRYLKQKVYNPDLNKGEIAALAKLVAETMKQGDELSTTIIKACLDELICYIQTIVNRLNYTGNFDCVISGSFIVNLLPEFAPHFTHHFPNGQLINPQKPPVYGSLKIAQELIKGTKPDHFWYFD